MSDPAALAQTGSFLHLHFPLSQAMGVRVESHDERGLMLTAPLELNHNHLGTAFGGSLGALALFAGYGLLWLEIGDENCHIVIRSSAIRYEKPVHGPLRALCLPSVVQNFFLPRQQNLCGQGGSGSFPSA